MAQAITNPALAELEFLLGGWEMTLSAASFLPDPTQTLTGHVEVEPIESGRLVALRQLTDSGGSPDAIWVIGRDDSQPDYTVLYADNRGVTRVYRMSLNGDRWRIWRDEPDFSQRFDAAIAPDRDRIGGTWEKRSSTGDWEHDFDLSYTRVRSGAQGSDE
jgi:hypothetical protein